MTDKTIQSHNNDDGNHTLKRQLTLPLLTLYGLGVTVGAGIYVLVGTTAAKAGFYAPVSFLLAAIVVAFTGLSYSEFGTRYPVSAGEAAYVKNGLNSRRLALLVGLMVALSGVVSSAVISIGAVAYVGNFIPWSPTVLTILLILLVGIISAWGILESVILAALFTLVEIGGLVFVIYYGFTLKPDLLSEIGRLVPPFELSAWTGIVSAGLLAFFAFVGFEDIANVAEEVKNPRKTLPKAILFTLVIATMLYLAVVSVVILVVPMDQLKTSAAPLALVFKNASVTTQGAFFIIAIVATLNGVLIQMIMASRVLYGLASQGSLPKSLSYIHPVTRTPLMATALVVGIILTLALFLPITELAEVTSRIVLIVFMFVNLALLRLKLSNKPTPENIFRVYTWVPAVGFLSSLLLLLTGFL
ncbi:MAG: amino acid permease [Rhizobiales bacterium]|nr:APC family permease [Hyphomicrobiales bacterium]NRB14417.1 amino acid permease [Hyphomicrobiales bacterium]